MASVWHVYGNAPYVVGLPLIEFNGILAGRRAHPTMPHPRNVCALTQITCRVCARYINIVM
jgi:hypothetical protein